MTTESVLCGYTAPILVLALGDVRLGDDGVGPVLLTELADRYRYAGGFIEFVDGGTQGLELLSRIAGRQALVVLDAVASGRQPGTVSVLEGSDVLRYASGSSTKAGEGILQVAKHFVRGERLTPGMLNRVEALIRAYDPCLSCSTHASGEMPLRVELHSPSGEILDEVRRPC
jgi:hydrogenase maturation protease